MKDKLTKSGHKKSYFIFRKALILSLCLTALASSVAVPVCVSIYSSVNSISLRK